MLARVRWGTAPGTVGPLSHLVLRVSLDGFTWLADVGFGNGTLLEPIPFGPGGPYVQSGWRFRVVEEDGLLVLQSEVEADWLDVYAFVPRPVATIDIEVANWFTSTHPGSAFTRGLIVAAQRPDGTRVSLSDFRGPLTYAERGPAGGSATEVRRADIPPLLAERFGLADFGLDAGGRVRPLSALAPSAAG
jgi:N-hydroxyarylamine O-acetyltransferase